MTEIMPHSENNLNLFYWMLPPGELLWILRHFHALTPAENAV